MSTVRYYRWDDAGAPTLNGQVGSLVNVLRKCLVGVAGIAYASKPSAGWSELFAGTGTNAAAFTNNQAEGGSGMCILVNDNAPGAGGAREARITGYAAMTNISTGTGATNTAYVRKSAALDAVARKWIVVADGLTAYLFVYATGDAATNQRDHSLAGFGDYDCFTSSNYRYFCLGRDAENTAIGGCYAFTASWGAPNAGGQGFSTIAPDGLGAAQNLLFTVPSYAVSGGVGTIGGNQYPTPTFVAITDHVFMKAPVLRLSTRPVGRMRGIALPYTHIATATAGEEFPGLTGQIVFMVRSGTATNTEGAGGLVCDSLGPW